MQRYLKHPEDGTLYAWAQALADLGWQEASAEPAPPAKPNESSGLDLEAELMSLGTKADMLAFARANLDDPSVVDGRMNVAGIRKTILAALNDEK